MRSLRRTHEPVVSVVVPVYDVAAYLPACLDSLLGQAGPSLEIIVVDDGSPDDSGAIADEYAARDQRVRVLHTDNHGLGAARNLGVERATGRFLAFADSDDVVPPGALRTLRAALEETGSDFVTGHVVRWREGPERLPWMRRLHAERRTRLRADDHPEILGDVFAWNKLFRRDFWERAGLSWPEGVRYEDQPLTTAAYLRGSFDVLPEVVYHWRVRQSSITEQRQALADLGDRHLTKRMAHDLVSAEGSPAVQEVFLDRVLAGDLWRYFVAIPGCDDRWWEALRAMVLEFWGDRSLVHSGLTPVHRLTGWLVEQDRRTEAETVMRHVAAIARPVDRVAAPDGTRIHVPGIDLGTIPPEALLLRRPETAPGNPGVAAP